MQQDVVRGWKPSAEDLQWAAGHLRRLRDGGMWGCTHGVYRVSHTDRTVTLLVVTPFATLDTWRKIHGRSYITFRALGYKVKIAEGVKGMEVSRWRPK